jgi:E3 ubiquitin-protein ligase HERC2
VLQQKLKYAIHFCKSIDTDDYARIALTADMLEGPESPDESNSDSDGEIVSSDAS